MKLNKSNLDKLVLGYNHSIHLSIEKYTHINWVLDEVNIIIVLKIF